MYKRKEMEVDKNIAILIPALNEEKTILKVINDFRAVLPEARIYVFDNNSADNTYDIAKSAGVIVKKEFTKGKGNVVRRMFADVEADVYVLVDGDDTYDASIAPILIRRLIENDLDMVNTMRVTKGEGAYRRGHRLGNVLFSSVVQMIFGRLIKDLLSGYRVFSRRFVKSFPAHSRRFEIETELTVHCLEMRLPIDEVETEYLARPEGSESKLSTWKDGVKILATILKLLLGERPVISFLIIATCLALAGGFFGWFQVILPWIRHGEVIRLPSAILATGCIILSFLSLTSGIIIHHITQARRLIKRFTYLAAKRE
jgi:glycosyltransferase involved in cell wall biosynthesis